MQAHQSINWKGFISNTWNWLKKRDRTSIPLQETEKRLSDCLRGFVVFVVCVLTNPFGLHVSLSQRFWQPIFRNVSFLWCEVERISEYGGQQGILYERVSFFCFISIGNKLIFLQFSNDIWRSWKLGISKNYQTQNRSSLSNPWRRNLDCAKILVLCQFFITPIHQI